MIFSVPSKPTVPPSSESSDGVFIWKPPNWSVLGIIPSMPTPIALECVFSNDASGCTVASIQTWPPAS